MGSNNEDSRLPHTSPFEVIREEAEDGSEYWNARELAKILGYIQYNKFTNAITRAEEACKNSGQAISDHFTHVSEMVTIGSGAKRKFDTVFLSRYPCYLIVQNADPSKPIVALGQTYFAVQTRLQEIAEELTALPEDQLRLLRRSQMRNWAAHFQKICQHLRRVYSSLRGRSRSRFSNVHSLHCSRNLIRRMSKGGKRNIS